MAPILSLPKDSLDRIRDDVALSVVSIWAVDESSKKKKKPRVCLRSGFVFDAHGDTCTVLTLSKDFDRSKKIFVQFENGKWFQGVTSLGSENSNLVAIVVVDLRFEPKKVKFSAHNADQCEEVVHLGKFDDESARLNFSSGSIGVIGHKVLINKDESLTTLVHCCSQKLYLFGGPVFNLRSELVGVNYSQREQNNLFFALDREQLRREITTLFGENMERFVVMMGEVETRRAKKRKK